MGRMYKLTTLYHDYEAHEDTPSSYKVRIRIWANNYRHAVIRVNKWIRKQNSEFNGYDYIRLGGKG